MRTITGALVVVLALGVTACTSSKFKTYNGPEVTRVIVKKDQRRMYLLSGSKVIKQFPVGLGFAPEGTKIQEGDGRTPEGNYVINRRNPNSDFHLSIGVSYPNVYDVARAQALGVSPGGDIFIHGGPRGPGEASRGRDWTAGCIALTDKQIEQVYAMVHDGTLISILP